MRIIYIFGNSSNSGNRLGVPYPGKRYDPRRWYDAGYIAGLVLQFLAGIGIGYLVGAVVAGVFRALCILL